MCLPLLYYTGHETSSRQEPRHSSSSYLQLRHGQEQARHRTLDGSKKMQQGQAVEEAGRKDGRRRKEEEGHGSRQLKVDMEIPEEAPTEGYGYGYGDNDGGGSSDTGPATLIGADAVLAKLLEAKDHPPCSSPPCKEVSRSLFHAVSFRLIVDWPWIAARSPWALSRSERNSIVCPTTMVV